tara:strand:- start:115 stop:408 length:294 start_codon:yes stop_codon:yes gene_type:complete
MRKFLIISMIIFLILFTAIIKNSTKRIDDQIFTINENIRSLKKDFENIKLEHDYLSSAEKLLEYQEIYFDDELIQKNIENIKIINKPIINLKLKNEQ